AEWGQSYEARPVANATPRAWRARGVSSVSTRWNKPGGWRRRLNKIRVVAPRGHAESAVLVRAYLLIQAYARLNLKPQGPWTLPSAGRSVPSPTPSRPLKPPPYSSLEPLPAEIAHAQVWVPRRGPDGLGTVQTRQDIRWGRVA